MIRTHRWDSLAVAALLLAGLGMVFRSEMLLSFAAVPITFVAYGALLREPPLSVGLERTLSPGRPLPGEEVTVTLTVTNEGEHTISDLRIVDGVPPELGVVGGSPRTGMLLRPGDSATVEYAVAARRGDHAFDPVRITAYTASGTVARRGTRAVETVLECRQPVEDLPLDGATSLLVGRTPSDDTGSGVEFHSLREYRPSDARSRIDWRRFAKSGELSTVEYHQDGATSVELLVDTRPAAFRSVAPEEPHAVEYGAYGAELCLGALLGENHRVGVGFYPTDVTALRVGSGPQHEVRARSLFDRHGALAPPEQFPARPGSGGVPGLDVDPPPETNSAIETLRSELREDTRVLVFTPLLDDEPGGVVNALRAHGFGAAVVSPDVTSRSTIGGRLSAHHRQVRIRALRERGVTVVDWDVDDPLSAVLGRVL